MVGRQLGEYVIEALLGAGGMAKVYKARHTVLDTIHAIKVLDPEYRESAEVRRRFLDEGKIQAKHLLHPNIVRVTNVLATEDAAALVMDYVDGGSLETLLEKRRRKFTHKELLAIAIPILDAMSLAHTAGIIHRDLKPANVLLRKTAAGAEPVIADFGIAKIKDPGDAKKSTHHETKMGTLGYSSPEQIQRAKDVTARSDIFSLGAMFYELLAGEAPFGGDSEFAIMTAIVQGKFPPLAGRTDPSVPRHVIAAVHKALASDPQQRFASCKELAAALTKQPDDAVAAPPPRSGMMLGLGITGAVLAAGVITMFVVLRGRSSEAEKTPEPPPVKTVDPWNPPPAQPATTAPKPTEPPKPPPAQPVVEPPEPAKAPTVGGGFGTGTGRRAVVANKPAPPAPAPRFDPTKCDEALCIYSPRYKGTACCAKYENAAPAPRPPPPSGGCDEVSCVLNNYAGACCAKFKKAASPPGKSNPYAECTALTCELDDFTGPCCALHKKATIPDDLDRTAISSGVASVRARMSACDIGVQGQVKLSVKVLPDGSISAINVLATPDDGLGECVAKAMGGARFPRTKNGGSFAYPFNF